MSIPTMLFASWRYFRANFNPDDHQTLIEGVCEAYRAEANAVAQYPQHAHRMYYAPFREKMLQIATEVQAHIPWLQEQLLALGGKLPQLSSTPVRENNNSWECLRLDVEEARSACVHLLECSHVAERTEPEIASGLQRMRKEKLRHCEEFRRMFMQSDPYTVSAPGLPQEHEVQQKQVWLEQRKNEWLEQERAAWEGGGKQMSWAEWSGEQEFRWTNELPYRDREWIRYLSERKREKTRSVAVRTASEGL